MRAEEGQDMENGEVQEKEKVKYRLAGSIGVKLLAFWLLIISGIIFCGAFGIVLVNSNMDIYENPQGYQETILDALYGKSVSYARNVYDYMTNGNSRGAEEMMQESNAQAALLREADKYSGKESVLIWKTGDIAGYDWYQDIENGKWSEKKYIVRVYYNPDFPVKDEVRQIYLLTDFCYNLRYQIFWILPVSGLLIVNLFIFLLYAAGRRRGVEEVVPSVVTGMHFDALTVGTGLLLLILLYGGLNLVSYMPNLGEIITILVICIIMAGILMLYLMEAAVRLKMGKWWQNTLIYRFVKGVLHLLRMFFRGTGRLIAGIPLIWNTVLICLGICILEFGGILLFMRSTSGFFLWVLEKIILLPLIFYVALCLQKLKTAGGALAEGREDYVVDTSRMFGAMKEHGENLNSIGEGITKAVAEKMRSEHLKTELITNVSHDLKTPLTSIINYADLIGREECANPRITEYAEVLLRQSERLKKLLENLIEASKATTGNLEVSLENCEVGVLLTQAVGEYQQRMEERGLILKTRQPEELVFIWADGRHIWRIFENLLNNICKYAQQNSRVYLSVEKKEKTAEIVFRNMSAYALEDMTPEELEERFTRGDKSRHLEGNGLGLSIAQSLTQLQGGTMKISIDGDLFKVILEFPIKGIDK